MVNFVETTAIVFLLAGIPQSNLLSSRKRRLTRHSRLHRNNLP